jgi:hypothetical protein
MDICEFVVLRFCSAISAWAFVLIEFIVIGVFPFPQHATQAEPLRA